MQCSSSESSSDCRNEIFTRRSRRRNRVLTVGRRRAPEVRRRRSANRGPPRIRRQQSLFTESQSSFDYRLHMAMMPSTTCAKLPFRHALRAACAVCCEHMWGSVWPRPAAI
jgi:hypothetical protein